MHQSHEEEENVKILLVLIGIKNIKSINEDQGKCINNQKYAKFKLKYICN